MVVKENTLWQHVITPTKILRKAFGNAHPLALSINGEITQTNPWDATENMEEAGCTQQTH